MATQQQHPPTSVGSDTSVTVKVALNGTNRRFKLGLNELGAHSFPQKLRELLCIPAGTEVTFERYSDSAETYMLLDSENPYVYKQLYRAAKAKLKLRIKASIMTPPPTYEADNVATNSQPKQESSPPRYNFLDTVLRPPVAEPKQTMSLGQLIALEASKSAENAAPPYAEESSRERTSQPPTEDLYSDDLSGPVCVDCNSCGKPVSNEHYHCSICDAGDYDVCQTCVNSGVSCHGENHWLIKRVIENGVIVSSATETIAPKQTCELREKFPENDRLPALFKNDDIERTCNACFQDFKESELVTCDKCVDFDLCFACVTENLHGHHPGHSFSLLQPSTQFNIKDQILGMCQPGRQIRHAAICDGCDKTIRGVRHKCLTCPDWDYCSECIKKAFESHPDHRFVPVYEPISEPQSSRQTHYGVFCDGPLCKGRVAPPYITGVRYKCAVCDDTDFCANCEAHPSHSHNRTHPLIKFKTPVRHVSVSTFGQSGNDVRMVPMGDQPNTKSTATETSTYTLTNAGTQVSKESAPRPSPVKPTNIETNEASEASAGPSDESFQGLFVSESVPQGSQFPPGKPITQTWTLYNPGPHPWPIGCCAKFVAGDSMFNVDTAHPSSLHKLVRAMESTPLSAPVPPFGSADFTVTLKSPQREGKAVSFWRLKTPEGTPFGHKLWCDINVCTSSEESQDSPATETEEATKQPSVVDEPEDEVEVDSTTQAQGEAKEEKQISESGMIFPKLEKEDSASSVHEATSSPPDDNDDKHEYHDIVDDVESLTLDENTGDDELETDDEYDILDASDQEFIAEAQKAGQN